MLFEHETFAPGQKSFKILILSYITLFTISIYFLTSSDQREVPYYVVMALLATVVLLEILLYKASKAQVIIILLQLMFLTLNILWGVTLKYYYFIGYTDVFSHTNLMDSLIYTGHITSVFDVYQPFPLWHIMCVTLHDLTGLQIGLNKISYIYSGLIFFFIPPAVYILSKKLFKNTNLALLSALIVLFNPMLINYGMYSIPRSAVSFIFIVLFFMLMERANKTKYYIAFFITFAIIVYHTASILYVLAILLLIYLLHLAFQKSREKMPVTYKYLVISIAMTLIYWNFFGQQLIQRLLDNIIVSAPSGSLTKSIYSTPLNEMFNYLQYIPTLLFVVLGILIVVKFNVFGKFTKVLSLVSLILIPITFPGPLMLINKLSGNLNLGRFEEYTLIFIALMSAVGFYCLYVNTKKVAKTMLVILFVVWVLLSVSNDWVAMDNPLVKRPFYTFYLTEEETNSMRLLYNTHAGLLLTDYVTGRYFESLPNYQNYTSSILKVYNNDNQTTFVTRGGKDMLLIRDGELNKRPLQLYTSRDGKFRGSNGSITGYDYYYKDNEVFSTLPGYSKVFSSKSISAYCE